ncbi:hypothetical protein BH20PSE1_BH20PSE1_20760 [soil metagenome]
MDTSKSRIGLALLAVVTVASLSQTAQAELTREVVKRIANQEITVSSNMV